MSIVLPIGAAREVIALKEANMLEHLNFNFYKTFWYNMLKIKSLDKCICIFCGARYACNVKNGKAVKLHQISSHNYVDEDVKINNNEIEQSLFDFITYDHISTTVLDSSSFRRFCSKLGYKPPRRVIYNDFLIKRNTEIVDKLKKDLNGKHVALAIDGWKSERSSELVAISGCYFNDLFESVTVTLGVVEVVNEKADTITDTINFIKEMYGFEITSVTSDNGKNMVKGIRDACVTNVRCMNHSLQLAINGAMVKGGVIDINVIVFVDLGKQLRTVVNKNKLNLCIPTLTTTRWNSLYIMLKKFYESKEILHQYYEEKTNEYKNNLKQYNQEKLIGIVNAIKPKEDELLKFIPSPTNIAYVILDKLCDILEPLYKLTKILEDRDMTMGMAVLHYKQTLFEFKTGYPTKIQEYAKSIKINMIKRLNNICNDSDLPLLCCMLDPRVKSFILHSTLGFSDSEFEKSKSLLINSLNYINTEIEETYSIEETTLDKYLEKVVKRKRLIMPNEVQEYLQYDIHYSTSETIGNIWLSLKSKFPRVYILAKNSLNSLATSSEPERIFSEAGQISNLSKSNLSCDRLQMKLMISRNK